MKNLSIFLEEYHKNISLMRQDVSANAQIRTNIKNAVGELLRLAEISRHEGLMDLDYELENMDGSLLLKEELGKIITLIVNGTVSDMIEEISLKRYYSRAYSGTEAVIFLLYLDICLEIQRGEHPLLMEENIRAILPEELKPEIDAAVAERKAERRAGSKPR